jgi:hypothetical protein
MYVLCLIARRQLYAQNDIKLCMWTLKSGDRCCKRDHQQNSFLLWSMAESRVLFRKVTHIHKKRNSDL